MTVSLQISLVGYHCNEWPLLDIYHDDLCIFDGPVVSQKVLSFDLQCDTSKSILFFNHKGKRFGDSGIWDTDSAGQDRRIEIQDIRFDGVSIGSEIMSKLRFNALWNEQQKHTMEKSFLETYSQFLCNGQLNFNGTMRLDFELPIYNWLIINKYKTDTVETRSYFSQYQENWHYEKDIQLIKEIKELMKFD